VYDFLRSAAAKYGCGFWEPGAGIIHQVVLENYAFPGELIVGTDSHTPNAGGLGACAVGVGGGDAVDVISGLPWEVLYPRRIAVYLTGRLSGWASPKDVILYVAGQLTVSGGTNAIVEYIGPGARTISATGKATITNMGAELGATTSMFPADDRMAAYLRATGRDSLVPTVQDNRDLLIPDPQVEADPEAHYDRVVRLDLSTLEPHIVGPHSPDRVRPISRFAAEVADPESGFVDTISAALIGSCTNSSYEDMSRAADLAVQATAHGIKTAVPLMVTPGSETVRATTERDGQMQSLRDINATVLANACGPCIGQWRRASEASALPNSIVTSYNRNFPRRNDGQPTTMNFIASPELAIAFALAGRLSFNPLRDSLTRSDGRSFRLAPPRPAPEVPANNFAPGKAAFVAPGDDGDTIELKIDANSERLQRLAPWPAWDGSDFLDMPVLLKSKGKTTTDHISPAGPWLRYRGHLDKFSDNMFMGATNAFTGAAGRGKNALSGEADLPFAKIARDYKARGSDDYHRVREDDRIGLVGLANLAPGRLVTCIVRHADGITETLQLAH